MTHTENFVVLFTDFDGRTRLVRTNYLFLFTFDEACAKAHEMGESFPSISYVPTPASAVIIKGGEFAGWA